MKNPRNPYGGVNPFHVFDVWKEGVQWKWRNGRSQGTLTPMAQIIFVSDLQVGEMKEWRHSETGEPLGFFFRRIK